MNQAEALWHRHHPRTGYPLGVLPVPRPIPGIAFFPGGYGLWRLNPADPLPTFPVGGTMVIGHDFHSDSGYKASLVRGREAATQPTWLNLLALLRRAEIQPERCFFTNLYLGLRAGAATTGPFPGSRDHVFVEYCRRFLVHQIETQKPSVILSLGINVPLHLGRLSPQLADWSLHQGLKYLDAGGPVRFGVTFEGLDDVRTTVVALTHPSLRSASVRLRRYRSATGDAAELAMLRDAMRAPPRPNEAAQRSVDASIAQPPSWIRLQPTPTPRGQSRRPRIAVGHYLSVHGGPNAQP